MSYRTFLQFTLQGAAVHVEAASDRLGCLPTLLTSLADLFALPAAPVGCIPHDISLTDLGHLIALLLAVAPLVVALSLFFLNFLSTSRRHRRSQQHRTSPVGAIGRGKRGPWDPLFVFLN